MLKVGEKIRITKIKKHCGYTANVTEGKEYSIIRVEEDNLGFKADWGCPKTVFRDGNDEEFEYEIVKE